MAKQARSPLLCYGVAVVVTAMAALLRWALEPVIGNEFPFITFFLGVALSAWFGGLGPGLLATLLGSIISLYRWLPPDNSWFVRDAGTAIGLLTFLFVCSAISALSEGLHRARRRGEENTAALSENRKLLAITLGSIGDAVIATDTEGRITFINPVAESLTGWRRGEAIGRPLAEVFVIVNEGTRQPVESPVDKVLREGVIVGLANHTVLIRKDGSDVPIDDSGAPIKDDQGQLSGVVLVFRDISERRRVEEALSFVASIVESSEDAIIGKRLDGTIVSWNTGAERLYGYRAEEVVGKHIRLLVDPEQDDIDRILEQLRSGNRVHHYETIRVKKSGERVDVALTISPIKGPNGTLTGASTIARDISERKQAERERERLLAEAQRARALAEDANRLKDEFLATVSHELRTPLNAIVGWSHMLRNRSFDEATTERALETIERNAKVQAQIVEDILDVSRIITGKLRLNVQPIDIASIIESALDSVRPAADAKEIRVQTILDPHTAPVSGDGNRLQQVVWNLLSNAVKFTPRGGRIEVRLQQADSHAEIVVTDTGQGIQSELLPFVFDRFRQGDSTSTRIHGGLGLGLAIVRHLIELHGGTVTAASAGQDHGAVFTVRLPLMALHSEGYDAERAAMSPPLTSSQNAPDLSGLRVLIVDDEPDTRDMLRLMIEQFGAQVRACASSREAVGVFQEWPPNIIISDIEMPGEDGYQLMRQIRELAPTRGKTPAVALTAYARAEDRLRAISAGYQMHVAKPADPLELALVIARLASRTDGSNE
ncbi:MAG: PAS domain S-box protein [Blastocatellia bacterium]